MLLKCLLTIVSGGEVLRTVAEPVSGAERYARYSERAEAASCRHGAPAAVVRGIKAGNAGNCRHTGPGEGMTLK